jgi:hypothetical protein
MKRTIATTGAAWALLCVFLQGCAGDADPYSTVAPHCMGRDPWMGYYLFDPVLRTQTYLTPECKAALESVVPMDSSFDSAPEGMRDKVLEAFQAIVAYPIAVDPDDVLFLGSRPDVGGAIPAYFLRIYQQWQNPNQALFNYILNHTDVIRYKDRTNGKSAEYYPTLSSEPRKITIYNDFWSPDDLDGYFRHPFGRAGTLVHEARHGDSLMHIRCARPTLFGSEQVCDSEFAGPYGFEAVYSKYLLRGSAACIGSGCAPALPQLNVLLVGAGICLTVRKHLNHRWPELDALLGPVAHPYGEVEAEGDEEGGVDEGGGDAGGGEEEEEEEKGTRDGFCASVASYDWIMDLERLPKVPSA